MVDETSFVGRAGDLAALGALFARGERLITIVGPGGVGKTRLARRFAGSVEGAAFCALGEVRDAERMAAAVAEALGLVAGPDAEAQVAHALRGRERALVVLDEFEGLVANASSVVAGWLAEAPEARLLVTSRERLKVEGEVVYELKPLGASPGGDAVQLFVDRARAVRPGWGPGREDLEAVAEIVRRLDGLPLAIELAAARIALLGPAEIRDRLEGRLALLGHATRDGARHATLRDSIDASWDVLAGAERAAFAQASVFAGGFSAEAAERVVALHGGPPLLDVLQSLRDRSLLRADAALPGEMRLSMYESLREYAAEKAREGKLFDPAAERHVAYYLEAGEAWADAAERRGSEEAVARLALERENLLAAAARAGGARAVRAHVALGPLTTVRGPFRFSLQALDEALARAGPSLEPRLQAGALGVRAWLVRALGRTREALETLERALALPVEGAQRGWLLARAGVARQQLGDRDGARAALEEAVRAAREAGERGVEAYAEGGLGVLESDAGRTEAAIPHYERSLAGYRELGARRLEGNVLGNLAVSYHDLGRRAEGRRLYGLSLEALRETGDRPLEAHFLACLANLLHDEGKHGEAEDKYREAVASLRELGNRRILGINEGNLARLLLESGRAAQARDLLLAALEIVREVHDARHEALLHAALGAAHAVLGDAGEAESALARAAAIVAETKDPTGEPALAIHRGQLELLQARRAPGAEAARLLESARERARRGEALAAGSDEVRFALRLLKASLDAAGARALEVHPEGEWLRLPGAKKPVSLRRRAVIRRLLARLARARTEAPGVALSSEDLLAAGWPGERILPRAASNRLHVALTTLRKLGLNAVLLTREDGWLIDPAVPVVVAREPQI